jgi:hypothetical protein
MPVYVGELVKLVETLQLKQKAALKREDVSLVDKLLGKFELRSEKRTSTELLKDLRESGYGKY